MTCASTIVLRSQIPRNIIRITSKLVWSFTKCLSTKSTVFNPPLKLESSNVVAIEVNLSNFFIFYFFPLFTLKVHSWVLFVLILKTYSSVLGILKFVYGLRHANFCILLTNVFYSHWGLRFKAPQDLHLASQQKNASIPDFAFFFFFKWVGFWKCILELGKELHSDSISQTNQIVRNSYSKNVCEKQI